MRAGPPFPYLRWTGSRNWPTLPSPTSGGVGLRKRGGAALDGPPSLLSRPGGGSLQSRHQVLRERRLDVDAPVRSSDGRRPDGRRAGTGAPARRGRGGRTGDRRPPGGRSPEGERGSGAFAPSPGARAGASIPGSARSTAKCVTAVRGTSLSTEIRLRSRRSRPRGASIVPVRAGGRPSTSARYSRSIRARLHQRAQAPVRLLALRHDQQARGVAVETVHDSRPPGLGPPGRASGQRLGERAGPVAASGVHDDARPACPRRAGRRPRSGPRRARRCGRPVAGARPPRRSILSPPRRRWRLGRGAPSTRTRPPSIRRCARAREPSGPARNVSRRSPASAAVTFSSRAILVSLVSRARARAGA